MSALALTFRALGPAREHSLASPTDATPVVEVSWDGCALPALLAVGRGAGVVYHEIRRALPGATQQAASEIGKHASLFASTRDVARTFGESPAHDERVMHVSARLCPACGRLTTGRLAAHQESLWCAAWTEETASAREGLEPIRSLPLADALAATGELVVRRTALAYDGALRDAPTDTRPVDWAPAGMVWALRWVRDRGLWRGYAEALEALSAQTELAREAQRLAAEMGPAVRAWTHRRDQDAARELLLDALGSVMARAGVDAAPAQGVLL